MSQWRIDRNYLSIIKEKHLRDLSWHKLESEFKKKCNEEGTNSYYTISKIFDSDRATSFYSRDSISKNGLFGFVEHFNEAKNRNELVLTDLIDENTLIPFFYTFKKDKNGKMVKSYNSCKCMKPGCDIKASICSKNYSKDDIKFYCDECMKNASSKEKVSTTNKVDKPKEKPVDEPVDKQIDKPADKPVSKKTYNDLPDNTIPFNQDIIKELFKLII